MASDEVDVDLLTAPPQQPLQTAVTTLTIPAHPPTIAATNRSGRAASSRMPSWLRPMNRESRRTPTRLTPPSATTGQPPLPSHDRTQTQSQRHPSAPPHEPEQHLHAAHRIDSTTSTSSSPAPMDDQPVVCAAKGKLPAMAATGDEEQRDRRRRHVVHNNLRGRGGKGGAAMDIFISYDEGQKIIADKILAAKTPMRRVTASSGAGEVVHSKRARAAVTSDDDTDERLSWRRKTGGPLRPVTQSRNPKSIEVDDIAIEGASSPGKGLGAAIPDEETAPLREDAQRDLGWVSPGPPSGGTTGKQKLCPQTIPRSSECEVVDMDMTHDLSALTSLDELSQGDVLDVDRPRALDSADDTSDSDIPLALLFVPSRAQRQRASSVQKSQSKGKGKIKARADGFQHADLDASMEDTPLVDDKLRSPLPRDAISTAEAETPSSRSRSTRGKTKGTARNSDAQERRASQSTTPRRMPRTEHSDASDDEAASGDEQGLAHRTRPPRANANGTWRIVEPPKRTIHPTKRIPAPTLRPRVWTGSKDELFAALPALAKHHGGVSWDTLHLTLTFSGGKGDSGLGWWGDDAWEGRRITFSIVREVDVPLSPPSVSVAHDSPFDAGGAVMDTLSPQESSPMPPALTTTHKTQSPAIPSSGFWNREATSSSSSCLPEAGPSRVTLDNPASVASQLIGSTEVPYCGADHTSSPVHELDLRCDYDGDVGRGDTSMSCCAGNLHDRFIAEPRLATANDSGPPDSHSPGVQAAVEPTYVDTFASQSVPGLRPSPESRDTAHQHSCPEPVQIRKSPENPTTRADTCRRHSSGFIGPRSSELAHADESAMTLDPPNIGTGGASRPHGSEDFHRPPFPQPPPEVTALLTTQSSGDAVSPVFARNSPLVPWELPSEIGYFWLGLFKISEVKVETSSWQSNSDTLTAQRAWRFSLEWVPGGEDLLQDDEQPDYREWSVRTMRPWWEPEHVLLEQRISFEHSRVLLPLPLLAPFTANSTATGNFPAGYFCATCGRVNVQRFLRHRICESASCNSKTDLKREIGWVIGAFSTRDRKVNSATITPDDKWAAPTIAEPAIVFDDGTRLFHYHLIPPKSSSSPGVLIAASESRSVVDANSLSVRHIFNGNRAPLQAGASALFETLQRDVRIERRIGDTVFSTPLFESGDDPALRVDGRSVWDEQAGLIEGALRAYCCDLGPLRVRSLRIHAWISDGKQRLTFSSRVKYLILLCLGADISMLSILPDSGSNIRPGPKGKKESLRVTMVHGDIAVLSGSKFEFLMTRSGMCMLLEAECI